ncbi:MAG: UbiX family flavin prenyltransferase [Planctomycetes bacterium]|nr:UbiX family flavin prenyltransferase [Planctomycetota bacterium]
MNNLVLAITGASGSIYAVRLLEVLSAAGINVHLTISPSGVQVIEQELGLKVDLENFDLSQLLPSESDITDDSKLGSLLAGGASGSVLSSIFSDSDITPSSVIYHHYLDFTAGIASGSFLTGGMVICPCSMGTLSSLATGQSTNLIHRAADVHLKERRKLIVVPRETPLGSIQLENMKRLADAGAVILPAMPGFYHNPMSIHDLIDFVVGRICDQLGIEHSLFQRWGR